MKNHASAGLLSAFLLLCGCAPVLTVEQQYHPTPGDKFEFKIVVKNPAVVPEEAMAIFQNRMRSELERRALMAQPQIKNYKLVEVEINEYFMRHGAARQLVGIFAGTDVISTSTTLKRMDGSARLGQFSVRSSNNTAWGTSSGLIEDHVDKIVSQLAGEK